MKKYIITHPGKLTSEAIANLEAGGKWNEYGTVAILDEGMEVTTVEVNTVQKWVLNHPGKLTSEAKENLHKRIKDFTVDKEKRAIVIDSGAKLVCVYDNNLELEQSEVDDVRRHQLGMATAEVARANRKRQTFTQALIENPEWIEEVKKRADKVEVIGHER